MSRVRAAMVCVVAAALLGASTRLVTAGPAAPPAAVAASGGPVAVQLGIGIETFPGYVRVSEVVHLKSSSPRAFVGEVVLPLPPAARYVTYHEGLFKPRVEADRIVDTMTIGPGVHRVVYAYSVAGAGTVKLDRQATMPIERVDVLTLAPAAVRSDHLAAALPVTLRGQIYFRASGRVQAPGAFTLSVTGVPALRRWPAPAAAATMAVMLLLGLAVAMVRGGVGGTSWKRFQRSR
ncbi:MAG: hypothetical protein ACRDIC_03205 [bacterium]